MRTLLFAALAILAAIASTPATADSIQTDEAWARASIGTTGASAAYFALRNTGADADRLVSASAPVANRVELHTHIMENNTAKMREVEAIEVPAGGMVMLEPGGYHVMLMGLTKELVTGESFPLTLTFERAGPMTIDVTIRPLGASGHGGHGGHGNHGAKHKHN